MKTMIVISAGCFGALVSAAAIHSSVAMLAIAMWFMWINLLINIYAPK